MEKQGPDAPRGARATGCGSPELAPHATGRSPPPEIPDHNVLYCIGQGSYGEVWLAQNVLEEFRAIKVIYRRAFEHDRPFEREFEGIRKFEPVSRAHPSQLHVLHVGNNVAGGYFYYVMELADDAAEPSSADEECRAEVQSPVGPKSGRVPSSVREVHGYLPHTLKLDLDRRGRLPPEQCIKIGLALTTALEHLHEHGLVHRDIKPSNIIFVNGTPKLADIGLVAAMDATLSVVGTSGYFPPEGPGTRAADLYSLGKVLYEMAMGRDRQEFPKLPADLAKLDTAALLLELNAVILKACHNDPGQRYHCAKELAADLLLLQRGHSVRRLRTVERRLALLTKGGAVVCATLLAAAGLFWNAARQEQATARQLYVADMNLALQAWEGGNVTLTRELLVAHRKRQPEMLGFEWRHLAWLCEQSEAGLTLRGHQRTIWSVAFSPDGRTLATSSGDRTARLWDTISGRLIHTLTGHRDVVHAVAFSPNGLWLATGSRDFTVKLWDARSGKETGSLAGHTNAVRAVAFSSDGQSMVSAGEDQTLRWWNLEATSQVTLADTGFTVERLAFSPDGRWLAACGGDTRIHLWNCATRQEEAALEFRQAHVLSVAYSSTGQTLASASYDGTIRLWDTVARAELAILGRGAPVRCVAFAPGDKYLAAATDDGLVRLWDIARREVLATLRGHTANVRALAFSPTGRQLATGDEDAMVKLWNVSAVPGRENTLIHTSLVNGVAFAPDGRTLVSTDPGCGMLRLWKTDDRELKALQHTDKDVIWSVAFAPDGKAVATGGVDGTVRLWDATTLSELAILRGHQWGVDCLVFSPDGNWIASASRDTTVRVWQRATGKTVATLPSAGGVVRAVAFSPDGETLAIGCGAGGLLLWSTHPFQQKALLSGHAGDIRGLVFSPDGRMLASGGADRTIRLWDLRRNTTAGMLAGHTAMISSLAFSPDGRTLASGSWDSTVRLWNLRLRREVATLKTHSSQVTQVAFAPDGNTLASSSGDGTVRLWRAAPDTESDLR